ncbi:DUF4365 domain-containing protein [Lentzea flava]|uniref:DUF4365 domain-containing protein n=1 Tax=Lentzea flava TaxID=103732 RepID=A0ABQ2VAU3_9PSEU|nr:DUF4365 domain-containing protein [Lentzea flava]MCP2204032.1 protein of unknown function (DUF4365) [Lentzea flava]GGU73847.1 hypothetical protein GCM10010178_76610 [Lentzea flava]
MLDARNHQGKFGADYIRVLASSAGLIWSEDDVDLDGIDLCIKLPGRTPRGFSPRIDVQIKTVSKLEPRHGVIDFRGLDERQFSKLAGKEFLVPRYLFVVHVPPSADLYADLSTSGLLLRHIGYYVSLRDRLPIEAPDHRRRTKVEVPVGNVLTARSLRDLVTHNALLPAAT